MEIRICLPADLDEVVNDPRISFKAKGIFALAYEIDKVKPVSIDDILRFTKEGKRCIETGLQELVKYSYISLH